MITQAYTLLIWKIKHNRVYIKINKFPNSEEISLDSLWTCV